MSNSRRKSDFPEAIVAKTSLQYNKAFHTKIFTLFASSESEVSALSLRMEEHYDFCFAFISDQEGQWFLDTYGILKIRKWVLDQCKDGYEKITRLYSEWLKDWEKFVAYDIKISHLSDEELIKQFQDYYTLYLRVGSVAYIADSFMSTGEEDWLEELIAGEVDRNIVRKLTSPVHLSFSIEAEQRLLKIAEKAMVNGKLPPYEDVTAEFYEMEKDFHWIQNNYYNVKRVSGKEFYEQASKLVEGTDIHKLISEKEDHLQQLRQEKEKLMLPLTKFLKNVLEVAQLFSKWKDVRKSGVYMGMYQFDGFLNEISKRKGVDRKDLDFLVFYEVMQLWDNTDFSDIILKRKNQCFFSVTPSGYFITEGEDADRYFQHLPAADTNITQLKGVVACLGYARGRIRIIKRTEEMKKFQTGEILVANQTTPDFLPVMKKSSAIITEQGGITSHAAIVSRELGKPCIIGTRIATSVLMDGEMVEVDAHNGIIRRSR